MKLTLTGFLNDEERQKNEWERGSSEEFMVMEEIVALSKRGLQRCEEDCQSRQICGEDACACFRAIFPTPQHYEFYLETREFFLQSLAGATFAAVVSEKIGDKKA